MNDMSEESMSKLPALYKNIDVLDGKRHKHLRLRGDVNFHYSSSATILPVVYSEFRRASNDMPIVFVRRENGIFAQVVLGISDAGNSFVLEDGIWRPGCYVPAYIRRYPFILVDDKGRKLVGFETGAKHFSNVEGEPLFDVNGEPTSAIGRVRDFCMVFDASWEMTRELVSELDDAGVFVPAEANVSGAKPRKFDGFEMVDREKLLDLPAEVLKAWEAKGWLDAIHSHHASLENWGAIVPAYSG